MIDLSKRSIDSGAIAVVYNRRGYGSVPLKTARFHCFGDTSDLKEVIHYISTKHPNHRIAVVGYSAGSALAARFLGDIGYDGHNSPVICGVSVSPSYDIATGMQRTEGVLGKIMLKSMKSLWLAKNRDVLFAKNPEAHEACLNATSLVTFVHASARFSQYDDFDHYMHFTNPVAQAKHIKLPLMCVNAVDDPISVNQNVEDTALPLLSSVPGDPILVRPKYGSHITFLDLFHSSWANELVMQYVWAVHDWNTNN